MVQQAYSRIEQNITKRVDIEILVKLGALFGRDYNEHIVKTESRVNQRNIHGDNQNAECIKNYKRPRKSTKREQELEAKVLESQRNESALLDEILFLKEQLAKDEK